jgi:acyl-CoA synthetase (AMP-forming)/AMP-acid ligase II
MEISAVGDVLRRNAAAHSDKTAFVFGDTRVSFAEHLARAERIARAIAAAGVSPQDRVAVMSRNTRAFMEVYAGAELSGYIVATVNFRLAAPEVQRIVSIAKPRILFYEAAFEPVVETLVGSGVQLFVAIGGEPAAWAVSYEDFIATADPGQPLASPDIDDILHLIFTSGSTGTPKGVMRSHRTELAVCDYFATEIGMQPDDRLLLMMPVFHVGHRFMQLGGHFRAAEIHVQADFNPRAILDTIERERITITHLAPTMVKALLDVPGVDARDFGSLKSIVYSGAPMPVPHLEHGMRVFGDVFLQLYGMSEGSATTLHRHEHRIRTAQDRQRLASVGRASRGVALRIADRADRAVPIGAVGEVQLRAPTIMKGYWNDSEATVAALRGGWYHTGDMGRLDEDGYLYLVDRAKDMIISGGENIYSREVETAIASHPMVEDVAVIGCPDAYWGEIVLAIVVARDPAPSAETVIAHCRSQIASYKKPRSVVFATDLPRLASGKVDKVALRRLYGRGADAAAGSEGPSATA